MQRVALIAAAATTTTTTTAAANFANAATTATATARPCWQQGMPRWSFGTCSFCARRTNTRYGPLEHHNFAEHSHSVFNGFWEQNMV